jgi:hypothetical protein
MKNGNKQLTKIHKRGCFCLLKDCIRLCCASGLVFKDQVGCVSTNLTYKVLVDVLDDNTTEKIDLTEHEAYKDRLLFNHDHCESTYSEEEFPDDKNMFFKVNYLLIKLQFLNSGFFKNLIFKSSAKMSF